MILLLCANAAIAMKHMEVWGIPDFKSHSPTVAATCMFHQVHGKVQVERVSHVSCETCWRGAPNQKFQSSSCLQSFPGTLWDSPHNKGQGEVQQACTNTFLRGRTRSARCPALCWKAKGWCIMSWVSYDTVPEGWANRMLWPKYIFYLNQCSQSCIIAKLPKIETHKAPSEPKLI